MKIMKTSNKTFTMNGIKRFTRLFLLAAVLIFAMQSCKKEQSISYVSNTKYTQLNAAMRTLWADHMQWTFTTVDAFFNNQTALNANLTRLLKNQEDIGNAIVPYYGQAAGDQLTSLLKEHINLAVPVLQAAQANDNTALQTALDNWYKNAQDIADFLSSANPNWNQTEMRDMMKGHIDQTTDYSVSLLQKDYNAAVQKFEVANHHMQMMADDLSEGIYKQFPSKF